MGAFTCSSVRDEFESINKEYLSGIELEVFSDKAMESANKNIERID